MENEITEIIQNLQLSQKEKVLYQDVTFLLKNKNNKLVITPESSLTFDFLFYAISVLICYFLWMTGIEVAMIAVGIYALSLSLQRFVEMLFGISISNAIFGVIKKQQISEFKRKFCNVQFIKNS